MDVTIRNYGMMLFDLISGVPGTHDVSLGNAVIERATETGTVDLVILEGGCKGPLANAVIELGDGHRAISLRKNS